MNKRILSILLALCLALTLLPTAALANQAGEEPKHEEQQQEPRQEEAAPPADVPGGDETPTGAPGEGEKISETEEPGLKTEDTGSGAGHAGNDIGLLSDEVELTAATTLPTAVDGVITLEEDVVASAPLAISETVTIDGKGHIIKADNNFTFPAGDRTDALLSIASGNPKVTLKNVTIDGNEKCRSVYVGSGELVVEDGTLITRGKTAASYIGGVYATNAAKFTMTGGSITGNFVSEQYQNDGYCQYSSDLWIGANAKGTMSDGTVGNAFINANSYSATDPGYFKVTGGSIENIFVETEKTGGQTYDANFEMTTPGGKIENFIVRGAAGLATALGNRVSAGVVKTIVLGKDLAGDFVVPQGKTVTLDLNGKTLTNVAGDTITVTQGGTLTVTGTGTVDNVTHGKAALFNNGTVTLRGGTYTRSKENGSSAADNGGNSYYNILNHGTLTIQEGVTVSQSGHYSSLVANGYYSYPAGENPNPRNSYVDGTNAANPALTIAGGTFSGGQNTVKNDDGGVLTINGGTFSNVSQAAFLNWHTATISGGTFQANEGSVQTVILNGFYNDTYGIGKLTITGGNFEGPVGVLAHSSSTNIGEVSISGGNFKTTGALINEASKSDGTVSVSGGYFTSDPSRYAAAGKTGVASDKAEYPFTIGVKGQNAAEVVPAAPDVKNEIPGTATNEEKTLADSVAASLADPDKLEVSTNVLAAAATGVANQNTVKKADVLDAVKTVTNDNTLTEAGVAIVVQPYLDIKVTDVSISDGGEKTLTLDITPMYKTVATTQAVVDAGTAIKTEDGAGKNAVELPGKTGKLDVSQPVTITIPLPDGFTSDGKLTIKHVKDNGRVYYYEAAVAGDKKSATFTVTNGFSDFTIQPADTRTLTIDFDDSSVSDKTYSITHVGTALPAASTKSGYTFDGWKISGTLYTELTDALWTAAMAGVANGETKTVSAQAQFTKTGGGTTGGGGGGGGGGSSSGYALDLPAKLTGGKVTANYKNASEGTVVTLTVTADEGYVLDELTVTDKNGKALKLTALSKNRYSFTMPKSKVEIEASFIKGEALPFADVAADHWAYSQIAWAYDNGYMNGSSATAFNPAGAVSRQQLWMILARLSGANPADFAAAKAWAVDSGVSDGSQPGGSVTRQQLVTILYRYAQLQGYDVSAAADLSAYPDSAGVAEYARSAMAWAVETGVVGGTAAGTLDPSGTATRAQFAVILFRFCQAAGI